MQEKVKIPPLKTQGIKSKLVPFIKDNLPNLEGKTWYEPFFGSGVVGLNIAPKKAVFGDSNPYIIKLYQDIQKGIVTYDSVRTFLETEGTRLSEKDDEYYYEVRKRFNEEHSSLDFLFLNRSNFNGMIRFNRNGNFNVPYGHKKDRFSKAYITKITNQIKWVSEKINENDWEFVCMDAFELIKGAANAFFYLDPPYIGRNVDYYDSWNEENEIRLKETVKNAGEFMLSTWDHDDYRKNEYLYDVWGEYRKVTTEHQYFVGADIKNRHSVIEAVVMNY